MKQTDEIWQGLRYLLIVGGMWLASTSKIPGFTAAEVGPTAEAIVQAIGALATAGSIIWGLWVRWKTKSVPLDVAKRADVPTVSAATGRVEKPLTGRS